jgi:hypothetical protein
MFDIISLPQMMGNENAFVPAPVPFSNEMADFTCDSNELP